MNWRSPGWILLLCAAAACLPMPGGADRRPRGKVGWEMTPAELQEARRLAQAWRERERRDATPVLLTFLQSKDPGLRRGAIRGLGRLEQPRAAAALGALQAAARPEHPDALSVKLAIARIRSHGRPVEQRLGLLARAVGLSRDGLLQLLEGDFKRARVDPRNGWQIGSEVADLLYAHRRRGENLAHLLARVRVSPGWRAKLEGAAMPRAREIEHLLDYVCQLKVVQVPDGELAETHLAGLGADATEATLRRLRDAVEHPARYPSLKGIETLIEAIKGSGDRRAIPVLKTLEARARRELEEAGLLLRAAPGDPRRRIEHPSTWLLARAERVRKEIEAGRALPRIP